MKTAFDDIRRAFFLIASVLITTPILAAEVAQGRCLESDSSANTVVIEEYNIKFSKQYPYGEPTGVQSKFILTGAKIGVTPKPGDILRIAYSVKGGIRTAVKVMNVTRQDLNKK